MFICTFSDETYNELKDRLKLIQKIDCGKQTLYVFNFDKLIFDKFSNKEIFISNKLYFN